MREGWGIAFRIGKKEAPARGSRGFYGSEGGGTMTGKETR
jgi:hypothetical protein